MVEIEPKAILATLASPGSMIGALLLAAALLLCRTILFEPNLSHIPLLDADLPRAERLEGFERDNKGVYARGYKKFKSVFRIDTLDGPQVVIPPHLIDEVKNVKEEDMDHDGSLDDITMTPWIGISSSTSLTIHLVKGDLTAALNRLNPRLAKTTERAVASEVPPCPEWTNVSFTDTIRSIVAIVSGDIFIGPELCRNEEYLKLCIGYTLDLSTAAYKLKKWSFSFRHIGAYFVSEVKKTREYPGKAEKFFGPVIKQRRAILENGGELPDDLLSWALKKSSKYEESDSVVAFIQLRMAHSAINTTTMTGTILLRDIVSQPGLVEALRAETEKVLARHDGAFTSKSLYEMKLLDSVMKESQRMHMLGPSLYHNKTRNGVTLSDGTYLPPQVTLVSATHAASNDPANWPNAETFDPYRFVKLREASAEDAGKYQFVTVLKDLISFGYGKHACPGRFFAANEIKMIFIFLLRNYDIKLKEAGNNETSEFLFRERRT